MMNRLIPFVLFFIVANPALFKLVRKLAGGWVASSEGLPSTAGLLLHAAVFVLLMHVIYKMVLGGTENFRANKNSCKNWVGQPAPSANPPAAKEWRQCLPYI